MRSHVAVLVCAAYSLASCQQPLPRSAMNLLRAGDAGVCTVKEVEETLRSLIKPKGVAANGYTIAFADASLEAYDKTVARATCNTYLTVDGPGGSVIERTAIDYVVLPTSQDPSSFIVTGALQPVAERLQTAIETDNETRAQENSARQENEALAALVKPGWLIGRWVEESQGSQACATGPYDEYGRGGRYDSGALTGRWTLTAQTLSTILPSNTETATITDASM